MQLVDWIVLGEVQFDRFLTCWLLRHGYRTLYQPRSVVHTEAPASLAGFARQQLRWARGDMRYTILSLPWMFRYPYLAFTVLSDWLLRWLFLGVAAEAVLVWTGVWSRHHVLRDRIAALELPLVGLVAVLLGFLLSGLLWQIVHLARHPADLLHLPVFLFVTAFVLTPIKWYGDLTCRADGWMTRRVDDRTADEPETNTLATRRSRRKPRRAGQPRSDAKRGTFRPSRAV